tara:strand:- start:3016 stop:3528 length:513 start_codon:yes stop_codon:yes gene_type:complete
MKKIYTITSSMINKIKNLPYEDLPHVQEQVDEFIKRGYVKQSLNLFEQFGSREAESKGIDWEWTKYFHPENWSNVGLMFDKANPGHVIPQHTDHFKFYAIHFGIPKEKVRRRIVFLEDWKSGHYFQLKNKPYVQWTQGDYVEWGCNDSHLGGNFGNEVRYTLQITGVPNE